LHMPASRSAPLSIDGIVRGPQEAVMPHSRLDNPDRSDRSGRWVLRVFGSLVAVVGLLLTAGGGLLALLGGSWYYLLAGAALAFSGVQLVRCRLSGAWSFVAVFLA